MAAQSTAQLTISSVNKQLFSGEVFSVTVPGAAGDMTILPHHAALISLLKKGTIRVIPASDTGEQTFDIDGGALETSNNQITILV